MVVLVDTKFEMKFAVLLVSLCLLVETRCENTLVFVQVIFRHGERTPEKEYLYNASPYTNESYFKPYGFGQLTNKGKLTAYNLGKDLRNRYNGFLDEEYNINLIDARSSNSNRTKMSLQAVLAGLFPPTKDLIWLEGFNWQPIAYNYVEEPQDKELLYFAACPNLIKYYNSYLTSNTAKPLMDQHRATIEYVSENTGEHFDLQRVFLLYSSLESMEELNLALPNWVKSHFPYPMKNVALATFDIMVATKNLRQISTGFLLKKLLSDLEEKINGKIPEKKMALWSGHEFNIATLSFILSGSARKEIPPHGSYILIELHYINQTYGLKIYSSNQQSDPLLVTVPGCEEFCPLDRFRTIMKDNIPESDKVCEKDSATSNLGTGWIILIFQFLIVCSNILR